MNKLISLKERIIKNFKENKVLFFAVIAIWVIVVSITLYSYRTTLGKQSNGNNQADIVVELTKDIKIKEEMPAIDGSESVSIKVATFARKNDGTFNIKVTGLDSKTNYVNKDVNIRTLQDNAFVTIELDKIIDANKDKRISIELSSECNKGEGIGIYYSANKIIENASLSINEYEQIGDLSVKLLTESDELNLFYRIAVVYIISAISLILLIVILIKPKYELLFTIIAALIGIAFCIVMTPLSCPDEGSHYEYSFQMSNYMMFEEDHQYFDADYQDYGSYIAHNNVSSAYKKVLKRFNAEHQLDNEMAKMNNDVDEIYNLCFIPQATGITIARLLDLNRVKTFYLGRLFNLAFYCFCIYVAIKKTPIHKLLFGIIAILPMFLQQAASYSYDSFVNGLTFVTFAYLLKFYFVEDKIKLKEIVSLIIVLLFLAPCKLVYGLFSFLFWFVPCSRYGTKKKKILYTLLICAPALYQIVSITVPVIVRAFKNISELGTNSMANDQSTTSNSVSNAINESTFVDQKVELEAGAYAEGYGKITVGYLIRNPFEAFMIFFRTVRYSIKNWFYDSMGRTLSGVSLILPSTLVHIIAIIPIITSFRKETFVEPISMKIVSILICVVIGVYVMGGFLLSWTNINQSVIDEYGGIVIQGIQGRYFSPCLPYVFSIFNNKKINFNEKFDKYIIIAQLLVLFEVLVYILSYTFVN